MKTTTFLSVTAGVTLVWVAALLLIPPFARAVEQAMLVFLMTVA